MSILLALPVSAQIRDVPGGASLTGFQPQELIAPGVLATFGLITHYCAHETWDYGIRDGVLSSERNFPSIENYFQYVPAALHLSLGAMGVSCRKGFWDRFIESALAHSVCGLLTLPSKAIFSTLRPDGSNYRSFPSGHTSLTFTGAELVRMDYGPLWGAGAWGIGVAAASLRIYHNRHWFSDILLGAAIGILSARAGGWLLQPFKNLFGITTSGSKDMALLPVYDPYTRSLSFAFGLSF